MTLILLALVVLGFAALGYYYGMAYLKGKETTKVISNIAVQQEKINRYYAKPGFNEFLAVKELESTRTHLPWSTYINKILEILDKVKSVEKDDENNVILSDFKVNLQELSLNGVVKSLKTLYNGTWALLERFQDLEFLQDITVRKYERGSDYNGFAFTLSAKVVNDARTESGINQ